MELVVFQYMLIVFAQLLTVDSSTVCRHTRNTRVTKDVETMVTTSADDGLAPSLRHGRPYSANNNHRHQPRIAAHSTRCTLARDHPAVVHNHLLLPPLSHHIHTPLWPYFCPPADPGDALILHTFLGRCLPSLTPSSRVPMNLDEYPK